MSQSLSLSLCVFADAVYLHFCLWSLLLLQFFVDDVLPCLLSTTKGLFYCYPLMPVVKHFLNFRVLDLYLTHFFIGGQTNVCPPTLVFFSFLNSQMIDHSTGIREKILECQLCLEFNIFYLHNYVCLKFNIFIYIMKLMT